jgi:hypothetical protein
MGHGMEFENGGFLYLCFFFVILTASLLMGRLLMGRLLSTQWDTE